MSGEGMFFVACYTAIGFAVAATVHYLARKRSWRWIATSLLLFGVIGLAFAPFVEEARIASRFEELCRDSGVHVSRKVEAPGFYDATMRSAYSYIDRLGFQFMEHPAADDRKKVEHIEKSDGEWRKVILDRPSARYHLLGSKPKQVGHKVSVQETVVLDAQTNEVIARQSSVTRWANTVDQAWMGLIGSTIKLCPDPTKGPPRLGLAELTIVPIKR